MNTRRNRDTPRAAASDAPRPARRTVDAAVSAHRDPDTPHAAAGDAPRPARRPVDAAVSARRDRDTPRAAASDAPGPARRPVDAAVSARRDRDTPRVAASDARRPARRPVDAAVSARRDRDTPGAAAGDAPRPAHRPVDAAESTRLDRDRPPGAAGDGRRRTGRPVDAAESTRLDRDRPPAAAGVARRPAQRPVDAAESTRLDHDRPPGAAGDGRRRTGRPIDTTVSAGCNSDRRPGAAGDAPRGRDRYAAIPAVHYLLRAVADLGLPRALNTFIIRRELDAVRAAAPAGSPLPARAAIVAQVRAAVARIGEARLRPVINATGVLLHTNLGRAPLGDEVATALQATLGYTNLELDLERGERGGRALYVEQALAALCSAEAATVVNNCAAALLLAMAATGAVAATGAGGTAGAEDAAGAAGTAADRREVIVSRGELIQIGGGFRIPEILSAAGVRLREVGTTNRTTVADYADAASPHTAALLTVHRSNFTMEGFVAAPPLGRLAAVATAAGVPLVADLGSGAVTRTDRIAGLPREPTPQEMLAAGAMLVCFSGDKLFGGPQAGVVVGNAAWVERLKRHPLFRALRPDKVSLALLQRTVDLQLDNPDEIPLQRLLQVPAAALRRRAAAIIAALPAELGAAVVASSSRLGGGTLPGAEVPSAAIALRPAAGARGADALAAALRRGTPPVVGYIHRGRVQLDLRTVHPEQDAPLATAIQAAALR